ncbi:MAG: tRNA (adenosine(37)-N6)-dimethylallyltransferase MiaA [Bacteroidaceae bacterium]|nr:tRNA (adenosine(37)-N6)-dimethylallyltransferase MiaA [Bacteroidaceae bacterium]
MEKYDLIAIIGPTASGKTTLAAHVAAELDAEIISADSRQVYRRMDLGTGKDLADYLVDGKQIPYHLIDIAEPGTKYNVFQFQQDFLRAYEDIRQRGRLPVVCGGSGLYVESVLRGYQMADVPENKELRQRLEGKPLEELTEILKSYKTLHNTTDTDTAKRAIRAIEIEDYYARHGINSQCSVTSCQRINSLVIGVSIDRELRREKITRRLKQRLEEGMVDEVKRLLAEGIPADDLIYYGLEYKYLTLYAIGRLSYEEMFSQLEIAIHQFAKRQMTWFRGMERRGVLIHWIDATLPMERKVKEIIELMKNGENEE